MSDKVDYISMLGVAIQIQHECSSFHRETVFVEEKTVDGEIVWQGNVETFDLTDHPRARTCYAWQHVDGRGHAKIVTVIATPFVNSPRRAVQAAVFVDAQPVGVRFSKELELLRGYVQERRDLLRRMRIKTEDLAASIYAAEGIMDFIRETRNIPVKNEPGFCPLKTPGRFVTPMPAVSEQRDSFCNGARTGCNGPKGSGGGLRGKSNLSQVRRGRS